MYPPCIHAGVHSSAPRVSVLIQAWEGLRDPPSNSSDQCKALLLVHPAYMHILEGMHTPPCQDMHPMAAPQRLAMHPHLCELQFSHLCPMCMLRHTCVFHAPMFSYPHQGHTDTEMDMRLHNRHPTSHQCHTPTRSPKHLSVPSADHGPVLRHMLGSPAVRGLCLLQALSLSWHILACHHSAVTHPQALPSDAFGTHFAGTA